MHEQLDPTQQQINLPLDAVLLQKPEHLLIGNRILLMKLMYDIVDELDGFWEGHEVAGLWSELPELHFHPPVPIHQDAHLRLKVEVLLELLRFEFLHAAGQEDFGGRAHLLVPFLVVVLGDEAGARDRGEVRGRGHRAQLLD
jgi:hypothetical protein